MVWKNPPHGRGRGRRSLRESWLFWEHERHAERQLRDEIQNLTGDIPLGLVMDERVLARVEWVARPSVLRAVVITQPVVA